MKKFLHEFRKYNDGVVEDNGWWEIKGDKVINICGGHHSYTPEETGIIVTANDWSDLDWSCLIKENSLYGWVDLDGKFYGCDSMEHSRLAELYFKSDERGLENIGFAKIYRSFNGELNYYVSKYLTEKQELTLLEKNIKIN